MPARMEVLVTFPPKAPPIRLTWQVTLLDGMSSVSATTSCFLTGVSWVSPRPRLWSRSLLFSPVPVLATGRRCRRWAPAPRPRGPPACSGSPCRNAPGRPAGAPLRKVGQKNRLCLGFRTDWTDRVQTQQLASFFTCFKHRTIKPGTVLKIFWCKCWG